MFMSWLKKAFIGVWIVFVLYIVSLILSKRRVRNQLRELEEESP